MEWAFGRNDGDFPQQNHPFGEKGRVRSVKKIHNLHVYNKVVNKTFTEKYICQSGGNPVCNLFDVVLKTSAVVMYMQYCKTARLVSGQSKVVKKKFSAEVILYLQELETFFYLICWSRCNNWVVQIKWHMSSFHLTLIGMSYESKRNAHLYRHPGVFFIRLNKLGRVSNLLDWCQLSPPEKFRNFW